METTYAYILTIPRDLFDNWGYFEHRGYVPPMPGELLTESEDSPEVRLGVTEPEAWEFSEASENLGEGFLSCVADPEGVLRFLSEIV